MDALLPGWLVAASTDAATVRGADRDVSSLAAPRAVFGVRGIFFVAVQAEGFTVLTGVHGGDGAAAAAGFGTVPVGAGAAEPSARDAAVEGESAAVAADAAQRSHRMTGIGQGTHQAQEHDRTVGVPGDQRFGTVVQVAVQHRHTLAPQRDRLGHLSRGRLIQAGDEST